MLKKLMFGLIVSMLWVNVSVASAASPTDKVRATVDAILATLKQGDLSRDDKRAKIKSLIQERFHFRAMSQRALAKNWRKVSEDEKKSFIALFSQLLQQTYMGKVEAYTDERVEYLGEKVKKKTAEVDTQIVSSSVNIPITYKVLKSGDDWLVYDVKVEEVSLISNYRTTYADIFKKEGMSGLLAKMQETLERQLSAAESQAAVN